MVNVNVNSKDAAILKQAVMKLTQAKGSGVRNAPGSLSVGPPILPPAPRMRVDDPYRLAFISSVVTEDNDLLDTVANQWAIYEVKTAYVDTATGDLKPFKEDDPRYYKDNAINMSELVYGLDGLTAGVDTRTDTGQTGFVPVGTPVQLYWQRNTNGDPVLYFWHYLCARYAKITGSTNINPNVRWRYDIELGYWDMDGDPTHGGTWTSSNPYYKQYDNTDDDGPTYTDEISHAAFSDAESMNTGTSGTILTGAGVDVDTSDGTVNGGSCVFQPLPTGDYVQIVPRYFDAESSTMYWTIVGMPNSAQ